jgi:hypothetical protein
VGKAQDDAEFEYDDEAEAEEEEAEQGTDRF